MPGQAARKGLSPGWIAFIAIDVILVIAVLVYAMTVFGGSPGSNNAGPKASAGAQSPSPSATQAVPPPAAELPEDPEEPEEPETPEESETPEEPPVEAITVASPTGNIECTIADGSATCTIASLAKKPKKDKACGGYIGYVYVVSAAGVDAPCVAKADLPQSSGSGAKALAYGKSVTGSGFTCVSSEDGMGCALDESGKGFKLSRSGAQTF